MRNPLVFLPLVLTLGHTAAHATGSNLADSAAAPLIQQAQQRQLASDPHWLALLHYRPLPTGNGAPGKTLKSGIISPEFFLAPNGAEDPAAELAATLNAFFLAPAADQNQHPQCRFVARYRWLRKTLDWREPIPPAVRCDAFREWSIDGQVQSISVIFASGYLSNPASLYGHLLLKFNTPAPLAAGALLDPSMSYGALVPPRENGVVYLYKGLLGGYDAGFSHEKFFRHNHSYAEKELRDLWEYQLALDPEETAEIVAHSWELLRVKFHYYFFSENCASAIAELLRLIVDEPLLPDTPWAIPSTVFDKLATIQHNGHPLIADVRRMPSRQNRFYAKYFALSAPERALVDRFAHATPQFEAEEYTQLPAPQKVRIVETLLDYYQFLAASEMEPRRYQPLKQQLLAERLRLPAGQAQWPPAEEPPRPDASQPPLLLQPGAVYNDAHGAGIGLRLRPAYYDFIAPTGNRAPYSTLSMFDLQARIEQDRLRFKHLTLVEVETLNLSRTGLPGDGGNAWHLKVGFEQQDLRCVSCTLFALDGGVGRARPLGDSTVVYALLEGRVQTRAEDSGTLAATPRLGLTFAPTPQWRTRLDIGVRNYVDRSQTMPVIRWENRFGAERNWDIRLNYEKQEAQEISAGLALYW
jgi:hypothetical protein